MHDHVLERYLSLVYVLRDRDPGTEVPLRGEDIDVLAASLAERRELIEEQLLTSMLPEQERVRGLVGWLRKRLWVPGAGAVVGAVSIGTLIMVSAPSEQTAETTDLPEPEPDPEGGALRNGLGIASLTVTPSTEAPASSTTQAPETTTSPDTSSAPASGTTTEVTTSASSSTSTSSSSTTPPTSDAPNALALVGRPQQLGAEAEALLPFDWQVLLPGWEINYLDQDDRFRGLTYPYEKSIDMFVRDSDTAQSLAGILAHELGHAIDVEHFDDGDRNQWRDSRGIGDAPWWPDAYARDFQTGAGDFAESFAYWAVDDPSSSEIGGAPNAEQLRLIESYLDDI